MQLPEHEVYSCWYINLFVKYVGSEKLSTLECEHHSIIYKNLIVEHHIQSRVSSDRRVCTFQLSIYTTLTTRLINEVLLDTQVHTRWLEFLKT